MPRVEVTPRFEKALKRLPKPIRTAATKALRTLAERQRSKSLNLEGIAGRPGFYTIRATLAFRILLRREDDADGICFFTEDIDTHKIYRRS